MTTLMKWDGQLCLRSFALIYSFNGDYILGFCFEKFMSPSVGSGDGSVVERQTSDRKVSGSSSGGSGAAGRGVGLSLIHI